MNCLEVWGGDCNTHTHRETAGLELWVSNHSAGNSDVCGGHLHLVSSCASGRITRILLADVCGSGEIYRNLSCDLRDLMMRNVNLIKQVPFIKKMYQHFENFANVGGLSTALIGTYFSSTRSFQLCNAGHPPPFIFRTREQKWSVMNKPEASESSNPEVSHLGLVPPAEYHQCKTKLQVSDMVLLYSSAILEMKDQQGRYYSVSNLLKHIQSLDWQYPEQTLETMMSDFQDDNSHDYELQDKNLMLMRVTRSGVSLRDNLLSPLRLFRKSVDKTAFA